MRKKISFILTALAALVASFMTYLFGSTINNDVQLGFCTICLIMALYLWANVVEKSTKFSKMVQKKN